MRTVQSKGRKTPRGKNGGMYYVYVRGGGSMRVDRPGDGWSETSCRFIERGRGVSGSTVSSSDEPSMTDWSATHTHTTSRSLWYLNVVYKKGAGAAGAAPDRLIDHSMLFTAREPALTHDGIDAATAAAVWMNGLPDVSITAAATFLSLSYIPERERTIGRRCIWSFYDFIPTRQSRSQPPESLVCVARAGLPLNLFLLIFLLLLYRFSISFGVSSQQERKDTKWRDFDRRAG